MDDPVVARSEISRAIAAVYDSKQSELSFERLYGLVYRLVLHGHGQELYEGVCADVRTSLIAMANSLASVSDNQLLSRVSEQWARQQLTMSRIRDFLMYLDRTHVVKHNLSSVYDTGLSMFKVLVVRDERIKSRVLSLLMDDIDRDRRGRLIDRGLVRSTITMFSELGQDAYEDFERSFLESAGSFYDRDSQERITGPCSEYVERTEELLRLESQRAEELLSPATFPKLRKVAEGALVEKHAGTLLNGCEAMFDAGDIGSLARIYSLFQRACTVDALMEALSSWASRVLDFSEADSKPVHVVKGLLERMEKLDNVATTAFGGNAMARKMLDVAIQKAANATDRIAHDLAHYADKALKSTQKEADIAITNDVVRVLKVLRNKDVFESLYRTLLSKRLLTGNADMDMERSMLSRLKAECGYQYTSKMEVMIADMNSSEEIMKEYAKYTQEARSVALNVKVITSGNWPASQGPDDVVLPDGVSQLRDQFQAMYMQNRPSKKLTWRTDLGTAEICVTFAKKKHVFVVSAYQTCILMLFNKERTLTLDDIAKQTRIPMAELKRHLLSLCTPRHRVLNKKSTQKGIAEDDSFTINEGFESKHTRVKIPLVSLKETGHVDDSLAKDIQNSRMFLLESTIVRSMKTRKRLKHSDLVAEVIRQVSHRFTPDVTAIKRKIGNLIDREYIARDTSDVTMYVYQA